MNTLRPSSTRFARLLAVFACVSSTTFASLIYYIPFDDGSTATLTNYGTVGGVATEVSQSLGGAPVNGSGNSSFVTTTLSRLGGSHAARFPESRTRISLPDDANNTLDNIRAPQSGEAFTLSTWAYFDNSTIGYSTILGMSTGAATSDSGSGWNVGITNTGQIRIQYFYVTAGGTTSQGSLVSSANVIAAQTWANVVLKWSFGSSVSIFVNGVNVYQGNITSVPIANTSPVTLRGTTLLQDDFAVWDTALTNAEIAAISKAPAAIAGYDIGVLDPLFSLHRSASSSSLTVGSISWSYATGFDVTGKALGDVWAVGDARYMWLGGDSANASGLLGTLSTIPEPATFAVFAGLAAIVLVVARRRLRGARSS